MDSYNDIWELVRKYCKEHVTETIYSLWLEPLQLVSFEDDKVVLSASEFKANIIRSKFKNLLDDAFEQHMGFPINVEIISEGKQGDTPAKPEEKVETKPSHPMVNDELTFETFVVGNSNTFAHAAALAVANAPGEAYNPLFIYGNSGLGKTHLLYAICERTTRENPDAKILYTRGEDFTNELIASIQKQTMDKFHDKYRTVDVLLVDDVQFISGKTQTQEEFFHTFNALVQDKKQIVLTSDRPPKEIANLEDRIRTRFEWGLLADIQPPDLETRIAIIRRKAESYNLELPDDVVQFIAEKIKNNVRQLEGTVKKLVAYKQISNQPPSVPSATKAITDLMNEFQPVPVTIDRILNEVARTYGTTVENITSEKRNANITQARKAAIYIVREITGVSYEEIGKAFGGKHHSTVMYNYEQAEKDMQKDPAVRSTIQSIINNINESQTNY
ncbi:MAG: chromosomal replication initiator protein DnaA [Clostridia bacterium]|nr:chromosomal replication initiator protein DnaA [Clostridia bacterium]